MCFLFILVFWMHELNTISLSIILYQLKTWAFQPLYINSYIPIILSLFLFFGGRYFPSSFLFVLWEVCTVYFDYIYTLTSSQIHLPSIPMHVCIILFRGFTNRHGSPQNSWIAEEFKSLIFPSQNNRPLG